MRRTGWMIFVPLVGVLSGCPVLPGPTPIDPQRFTEPAAGAKYWAYLPDDHSTDRDWPLVVTLHGSWGWDGRYRQALEWKALAQEHGFIVVAPKLRSAEGILPTFDWQERLVEDERTVLAVLADAVKRFNVDPKTVMLTGFSAGGYPLYWIGLRNPTKFNMLVARACNSSLKHFEKIELTDEARQMPIHLFWGKDDLRPIQKQSWQAYGWLRRHRCFQTTMKEARGGHIRNPALAYRFWEPSLPVRHRRH